MASRWVQKEWGIIAIAAVVVLVGVAFWWTRDVPDVDPIQVPAAPADPGQIQRVALPELPVTAPEVAQRYELQGELPMLLQSDETLRDHLRLLAGALPVTWLNGDQILQKVVLQVENIAEGKVVYLHTPIVAPAGALGVRDLDEDRYVLDESSYARYNLYAEFLSRQDTGLLLAFYRYYEPLLDEAYIRLGNDPGAFRYRLLTALEHILAAPVIEGEIVLHRPLLNYEYEDETLEGLSMVHKQLIRMGPTNTRLIQASVRPFHAALAPR